MKINRLNKHLIVNTNTYNTMIGELAIEFNTTIKNIDTSIRELLTNDGVKSINLVDDYDKDIFEFTEMPNKDCYSMYNTLAFLNEYKSLIEKSIIVRRVQNKLIKNIKREN